MPENESLRNEFTVKTRVSTWPGSRARSTLMTSLSAFAPTAAAVVATVANRSALALELAEPTTSSGSWPLKSRQDGVEVDSDLFGTEEALLLAHSPTQTQRDLGKPGSASFLQRNFLAPLRFTAMVMYSSIAVECDL